MGTRAFKFKNTFMALIYEWGSTASRLQSHFEQVVCFSALSSPRNSWYSLDLPQSDERLSPWLFKSFEFGNGRRISDEKLTIFEFKYLQNKK